MSDEVPERLVERDRWVCWTYEMRDDEETKPPIAPFDGKRYAATNDPETWRSHDEALAFHERDDTDTEGVGYMLGDGDLVGGADLDGCRHPETTEIEAWAEDIVKRLDSYTEVSPSETGLRIFVMALMPDGGNRKHQERTIEALDDYEKDPEVEMYDTGRYLTFTGDHVEGTPTTVEQRNDAFSEVHADYIADDEDDGQTTLDEGATVEEARELDLSDEEILDKARNAENGQKFQQLERGHDPANNNGTRDTSYGDKAFCQLLAFWTGGDRRQIDRLFRNSGRMRSKWDEDRGAQTYGDRTIDAALADQTEFYDPGATPPTTEEIAGDGGVSAAQPPDASGEDTGAEDGSGTESWTDRILRDLQVWLEDDSKDGAMPIKKARSEASTYVQDDYEFITPKGKRDNPNEAPLYVYWPEFGYFEERGTAAIGEDAAGVVSTFSTNDHDEIANLVKRQTRVNRETLDAGEAENLVVNLENAVFDIDADERLPHSAEYRFRMALPFDHDPEATCDRIDEFLDNVTADERDKETLYEYIGYCLETGYPIHSFLLLYGPGGNGKGVFFRLVREFLGSENTAAVSLNQMTGENSFSLAQLDGKMVNIDGDIPGRTIGTEELDMIKKLSGGDTVEVQHKYGQPFDLDNRAKLMFAANEPPRFHEASDAVARRLLDISFPYRFTTDDDEHKDAIPEDQLMAELTTEEELSGLFNRAVEAYQDVRARGDRFSIEDKGTARERFEEYRSGADPIVGFAQDCLKNEQGFAVPQEAVYAIYSHYCQAHGHHPANKKVLFKQLRRNTTIDIVNRRPRVELSSGSERPRICDHLWITPEALQHVSEAVTTDIHRVVAKLYNSNAAYAEDYLGLVPDQEDGEDDSQETSVPEDAEGIRSDSNRLCLLIKNEGGMHAKEIKPQAAEHLDLAPDRVDDCLQYALDHGHVLMTESDRVEVT